MFFVHCGASDVREVGRFTLNDIKANALPTAAKVISRQDGLVLCRQAAKGEATHPSTIDFSTLYDFSYQAYANGNALVKSSFTSSNDFGMKQKYAISCLFNGKQKLSDVMVKVFR